MRGSIRIGLFYRAEFGREFKKFGRGGGGAVAWSTQKVLTREEQCERRFSATRLRRTDQPKAPSVFQYVVDSRSSRWIWRCVVIWLASISAYRTLSAQHSAFVFSCSETSWVGHNIFLYYAVSNAVNCQVTRIVWGNQESCLLESAFRPMSSYACLRVCLWWLIRPI
jgi:hypothetical protein